MKRPSPFIIRTAAYSSGTAFFMIGQLVFMTLLARLGDPIIFGAYTLATALLNPVFFLARMGMRSAQATETRGEFAFRTYRGLQYLLILVATLVTFAMIGVLNPDEIVVFVVLVVAVAKVAETVSDLHYGLFLRYQKQHDIAVSLFARAALSVLLLLAINWFYGPKIAMLALPLSWTSVLLFHDLTRAHPLIVKEEGMPSNMRQLLLALKLLFPLAIAGFLGQLAMSTPRYVIGFNIGTETLGQIGPALMAHVFVNSFAQSITQSLLPNTAENIKDNDPRRAWNRLLRVALKLLPLVLFGIVLAFTFGPFLTTLIFGPSYELAGTYLGLLSLSWSCRAYANLFGVMILASRNFVTFAILQAISFCVYLVLTISLWYYFSLSGVIWALVIGSGLYLLVTFFVSQRLGSAGGAAGGPTGVGVTSI